MKAIRKHLRRAHSQLKRARRPLERARHLAIARGCGSTCIAATTKALADNYEASQRIADIAAMLQATNPDYKPRRS